MNPYNQSEILLSAVAANTTGAGFDTRNCRRFTATIKATVAAGAGATIAIQHKTAAADWAAVDSRAIAATGDTVIQFSGPLTAIRAVVSAYDSGTFTVSLEGIN